MVFSNGRTNLMGATFAVSLTLFSGLVLAAEQRELTLRGSEPGAVILSTTRFPTTQHSILPRLPR